ncbi:hypothetical protein LTR91_021684 [Friedmanniomyces endolithicus]|uniref:Rhodopsin domain-containing protein n=2 Tax=Friedmanniomyces endolithicus TaxID=329885 RepID=A0AAN6JZC5_9PEZI|nr:hypothetical protein LTR57_022798 [Friedmanniomyces endolithicus]KAK0957329.1 hypothetical protein LTS01_022401 [Friedmanniomyces endolithicus]KAK0957749.1 hypothetical protein LTR91_021684 [Friedmanniomyces endolithicus]KAK1048170.1 hypothetical protein LTS16_004693 [Friedmanniomyces endolithicus]
MPGYAGTLYAAGTLMIALRLWLRLTKQAGALGLDDSLIVCAWLAGTMFTVDCFVAAIDFHIGRHVWDIPLTDFENLALLSWLAEFSFLITGACIKISVLLFYRRLVKDTYDPRWRSAVIAAIAFTAAYSIAFLFTLIFNCNPTEAYWKSFDVMYAKSYTCVDTTFVNLLAGIFAIISDVYAVVLPCLMTRHFDLATGQKVALNIIFSLGLLVVAASAARTYYFYQVGRSPNVSPMIFNARAWSQLELQLGIICASFPALPVLFRRYLAGPASHFSRSAQSSRGPMSILPGDPPDDQYQLGEMRMQQEKTSGETTVAAVEGEKRAVSPSSTTASTRPLVKSPAEYEEYNLDVLRQGRNRYSVTGRPHADTIGRKASHRLSQPVPEHLPP